MALKKASKTDQQFLSYVYLIFRCSMYSVLLKKNLTRDEEVCATWEFQVETT